MNIEIDKEVLRLGQHHNLTLRGADGSCIHVHWGRVWVTRNGDLKDYIVGSGESLAIDRTGTTLVTAMTESGLSVMERCKPATGESDAAVPAIGIAVTARDDIASALPEVVYPGVAEIDRHVRRAKELRARYFAEALQRGWNAVRSAFMALRRV